jgi:hypothetical protein
MSESDNSPQGNPAWDEFYNAIPETYREELQPAITPVLQKWDQGVQKRFEKYKNYEKYVNDDVDPQVIDYGMNLVNSLGSNDGALEIFGQLGNYLEQQGLLGQEEDEDDAEEGDFDYSTLPPALKRQLDQLQDGFGTLAEYNLAQEQARIEAEEDQALDAELNSLQKKYGDYDEEWVLSKMANGMGAEDAVQSYHSWLDNTLKSRNRPSPFRPLGGGTGDFPSGSGNFDPRKASSKDTKDFVAQMLYDTYNNK